MRHFYRQAYKNCLFRVAVGNAGAGLTAGGIVESAGINAVEHILPFPVFHERHARAGDAFERYVPVHGYGAAGVIHGIVPRIVVCAVYVAAGNEPHVVIFGRGFARPQAALRAELPAQTAFPAEQLAAFVIYFQRFLAATPAAVSRRRILRRFFYYI